MNTTQIFTLKNTLKNTKHVNALTLTVGNEIAIDLQLKMKIQYLHTEKDLIRLKEILKDAKIPYTGIFDTNTLVAIVIEQIDDEILKINKIYDTSNVLILPST